MKGEAAYIKETQTFLNQIESIIISRNENVIHDVWRVIDLILKFYSWKYVYGEHLIQP